MKHIRKFNESLTAINEIPFDESYMVKTLSFFSCIPLYKDENTKILHDVIKNTLNKDLYDELFSPYEPIMKKDFDLINFFITNTVDKDMLITMFDLVAIHEGSDYEDEWIAALTINNFLVLLSASPERGSMIRVGDFNGYLSSLTLVEAEGILKELCKLYNDRL